MLKMFVVLFSYAFAMTLYGIPAAAVLWALGMPLPYAATAGLLVAASWLRGSHVVAQSVAEREGL